MPLTLAQLATLKSDIAADGTLNTLPNNGDGNAAIAAAYNLLAAPAHYVWQTAAPINDVLNAVVWANMTPVDAVPVTPALTVDVYRTRQLACQGKQMNLQNLILGRATIDATKANIRAGLQDSLTGYPAGASGATIAAGWTAVQLVLSRQSRRGEKLFATGTGTQAVPATMAFEGQITGADVESARNLP